MRYINGQLIYEDRHFKDHMLAGVPVQVFLGSMHGDIGYIEYYGRDFVKVNNYFYCRKQFSFVSRP